MDRLILTSLLLFLTNSAVHAQNAPLDATMASALRVELEQMLADDQTLRQQLRMIPAQDTTKVQAYWERQKALDAQNIARLSQILDTYGWPDRDLLGQQAVFAAFLILQHASYEMMNKYVPLIREAAERGEFAWSHLALMEDRLCVFEGKPQIYGTQVRKHAETGKVELYPIEDEANVEKRREAIGMIPLKMYLAGMGIDYEPPSETDH